MKKFLSLFLVLFMASCASVPLEPTSDMWQYDDDKFVSFKKQVIMSWEYDDPTIGCFEVDREIRTLSNAEIDKIKELVNERNAKGIIEIETKYRSDIVFKDDVIAYILQR